MNDRIQKMMVNYLEISCQNIAQVVDESEAQAEIVDIDLADSKSLLKERLAQQPFKPIIALSLQEVSIENVIYVKKPIEIPKVIDALKTAKKKISPNKITTVPVYKPAKLNDNYTPSSKQGKSLKPRLAPETKTTTKINNTSIAAKSKPTPKQKNNVLNKEYIAKLNNNATPIPKPKKLDQNSLTTEINKPTKLKKTSNQKTAKSFSIHILEIDRLLKELRNPFKKLRSSEKKKIFSEKNNRKTVRYAFEPIKANLKKNTFTGNKRFVVLIKNLSSRGAVIELKRPSRLRGKVTLKILFDSKHTFVIPAKITRREGTTIYGLQFLKNQHELLDYQIDSGHSFVFS